MLDISKLIDGDRRIAAKMITVIENEAPEKQALMAQIYPHTGKAHVLGITGSPGAGKSSLVDELTKKIRQDDLKVGIIAVDPTSPISGGALLGDRIRMQEHALDRGVFIRSMGTRGCLGGLARATKDAIKVLDAFGCDVVLVETVGVGQSELDIMHYADTTVVVLTPGAGDHIQIIKAGIMEIADLFVINKSDLGGTRRIVTDIEAMLDMTPRQMTWRPPVITTSTTEGTGLEELWTKVIEHHDYIRASGALAEATRARLKLEVMDTVSQELYKLIAERTNDDPTTENLLNEVVSRRVDPYSASRQILGRFIQN